MTENDRNIFLQVWPSRHHCHDIETPHALEQTCEELSAQTQVGMKIPHQDQDQPLGWANASVHLSSTKVIAHKNDKTSHWVHFFSYHMPPGSPKSAGQPHFSREFRRSHPRWKTPSVVQALEPTKFHYGWAELLGGERTFQTKKNWKFMSPQFHLQMVWKTHVHVNCLFTNCQKNRQSQSLLYPNNHPLG